MGNAEKSQHELIRAIQELERERPGALATALRELAALNDRDKNRRG